MIRTRIQLTEVQARVLRSTAAAEQVGLAEVIRRTIDDWLAARGAPTPAVRRRRALAAPSCEIGAADVADRHDEYWEPD